MDYGQGVAASATRRGGIVTAERWRRIKHVFQAAAERAPGDREAYLVSETAGDDELRHEVDKMLRHVTGAGILDRPAWEGLRIERKLDAGSRVGPYEIIEEAGAGGMGRVYKAHDTRLGRTVAIKVLSAEFSHRLRIEGRAISSLNHPHVCALYDIGEQEGTAYLVMEYVEGESLAARLLRGALPADAVIRYGAEIASALAAAHARGIVHCDLKPANIMVTASGAKVLDFGVARIAHDQESSDGPLVGTAAYMSPSQLNGNPADARSDIFALGLVLYEMLTGTRHSPGLPKLPANLPAGLGSLIDRCLRKDATDRVQHMEDVRVTLERLRSGRAERSRWLKPAGAAALLALAVTGAVKFRRNPRGACRHRRRYPPRPSPNQAASVPMNNRARRRSGPRRSRSIPLRRHELPSSSARRPRRRPWSRWRPIPDSNGIPVSPPMEARWPSPGTRETPTATASM
jgi:serine/threonine protein kinase